MQSGPASSTLASLAAGYREANFDLRQDVTSPAYWAGACASASVWLLFILCAVARSLG
jgi:hypothetical protein